MKRWYVAPLVVLLVCLFGVVAFAEKPDLVQGEENFKKLCAVCHPDGGNIVNPAKTLHKNDRDANNIKTSEDIISRMRNPGPGMTKFSKKVVSDKEARAIAEYILKTF